jgi:hypothetical protein
MPVGPTLEGLLGVDSLITLVQVFNNEDLHKTCISLFEEGQPLYSDGETVKWDEERLGRDLAPVVGDSSPAPQAAQTTLIPKMAEPIHIKQSITISGRRLFKQRASGGLLPNAASVVRTATKNLHQKVQRTREYIAASTLLGALTANSTTIKGSDQNVSINYTTSTYAGGAWSNPATLINSVELPAFMAAALQGAELMPALALYNDVTEQSILKNTELQNWWAKTPRADAFVQGGILDPKSLNGLILRGVEFRRVPGGYVPPGGSYTRYIPNNKIVVLPQQLDQVLGLAEVEAVIPEGEEVYGGENAFGGLGLAPSKGWYAYAYREKNPPAYTIVVGYVGLPVLINPLAVCVGTVT